MNVRLYLPLVLCLVAAAACAPAGVDRSPAAPVATRTAWPTDGPLPLEAELALAETRTAGLQIAGTATKAAATATRAAWLDGETATWAAIAKTNQAADRAGTAQAADAMATAARGDTQTALPRTETAAAAAVVATATALADAESDRERVVASEIQRPWMIMAFAAGLALMVFGYFLYRANLAHQRETARQSAKDTRIFHGPAGIYLVAPVLVNGQLRMMTSQINMPALPEPADDSLEPAADRPASEAVIPYTWGNGRTNEWNRDDDGAIDERDPEQERRRKKVMAFLLKASVIVGQKSKRIPTREEMQLHPQLWSEPVDLLKPYVQTIVGRGGGTYCGQDYPTIRDLMLAVGDRQIQLGTLSGEVGVVDKPWTKHARPSLSPSS
jgi:hypothetical protein